MESFKRSFHAAADLSAEQFHAVKLSDEYEVNKITNANAPDVPIGVLQNDPDADGQAAEVVVFGVCRARMGGTVSAGNHLGLNNTGEFIAAPLETGIGTADLYVCATALEDGANDEVIDILFGVPFVLGSTE